MRYLYKKNSDPDFEVEKYGEFLRGCRVVLFKPTIFHTSLREEKISVKTCLSRLYFLLLTGGRYRIFCLVDGDSVAHTSYVVPKCPKFPFLRKGCFEIGPCNTAEEYRRMGCYKYVLEYITSCKEYEGAEFYMIVSADNVPSVNGIEKAGFERCGKVRRTKLFKNYRLEK